MVIADTPRVPTPPPAPCHPQRIATADGLALAAQWHAPGPAMSRTPVVMAHGFGQTRQAWARSASALAHAGHPTLAFDARGHGESDRNPAHVRYAGEQFVDDLEAVTRQCAEAPVLVGASMGGLLGLLAQARQPRYSALVLVDITPRWEPAGVNRILDFMGAHPDGFDSLEHAGAEIARYLPHRRERKGPGQLRALLREGEDGRWRWHWDPRLLTEFARDSHQHQHRMMEAASQVAVPVLLLSGGRSDLVSDDTVREFMALVPHARHTRLPDATHMVAGDDNDAFTAEVLDFLSAHGTPLPTGTTPGESR